MYISMINDLFVTLCSRHPESHHLQSSHVVVLLNVHIQVPQHHLFMSRSLQLDEAQFFNYFLQVCSLTMFTKETPFSNLCSYRPVMSPVYLRHMGPKHTNCCPSSLFPLESYPQPPCPRPPPALTSGITPTPQGHKTRITLPYVLLKSFPPGWNSYRGPDSDSGIGPHYGMCWLILRVWLHSQSLSFPICTLRVILPAPSHVL